MHTTISDNTQAAVRFLTWMFPDQAVRLAAFDPIQKTNLAGKKFTPTDYRTFDSAAKASTWIEENQGKRNVYYHLNPLRQDPKKGKAKKTDMLSGRWLHIDADYKDIRPGLDWSDPAAVAEAHSATLAAVAALSVQPSVSIFTGGGMQFLYRLTAPFLTNGDQSAAEQFEAYSHKLALAIGADPSTRNIDRILRLPGTMNVLDERKRAAGRSPVLARVDQWPGASYELQQFTPHVAEAAKASEDRDTAAMMAAGRGYDDLMNQLPDWLRRALRSPGKVNADGTIDRSAGCFAVQCKLLERGFTPGEVFTVLSSSEIARKFIENGTLKDEIERVASDHRRRVAQKQKDIEIGNDLPQRPMPTFITLEEMLKAFVYVRVGSYVARLDSGKVVRWPDAVRDLAASRTVMKTGKLTKDFQEESKEVQTVSLWLSHMERLTVDVPTWAPGKPRFCKSPERIMGNDDALNTWCGLPPYLPPQNWEQWAAIFDEHVAFLVPIEAERRRFLQWLAHIVQAPGILPHTAYVMIATTHGIGRNWLSSVLTRVLRGYVAAGVDLNRILESEFNGQISQKLLAIVDEAHEGMDSKKYERGKTLRRIITEDYRLINPKCERQYYEFNACRWLAFSNYEDALPLDNQDRRFEFIENPKDRRPEDYYRRIYSVLDTPYFLASVRHRLQTLDISDFNPGGHAGWNEIKLRSLDSMTSEIDRLVQEFKETWPGYFVTNTVLRTFVQNNLPPEQRMDDRHFKHAMRRAGFLNTRKSLKIDGKMHRLTIVRNCTIESLDEIERQGHSISDWVKHWQWWFFASEAQRKASTSAGDPLKTPWK